MDLAVDEPRLAMPATRSRPGRAAARRMQAPR